MPTSLDTFYQTVAQLCFTLLGLWWLVLQTKYAEWIGNPQRRRMATNISLYFLLPGSMSLVALLAAQTRPLWQVAFLIASGIGVVETLFLLRSSVRKSATLVSRTLPWFGAALYALIVLAALLPGVPQRYGVAPLTVAGVMLTLLIVLGVSLAWRFFIEPRPDDALKTLP
ncbi:MAG TPA: hypothetical protein VFU88_01035 [Ktedonobacterales bacterium]|nr:hypothetical protein [Ktedonobacterales bacterium]